MDENNRITGMTEEEISSLPEVSCEGLPLVGSGVTGSVYRLDEGRILKVYKKEVAFREVERQERIARRVYEEGIPTARTDALVRCGECYGVIEEYLDAQPLVKYIGRDPEKRIESAQKMGALLARVHAIRADEAVFPPAQVMIRDVISRAGDCFTKEEADRLAGFLETLPGKPCVLHGDFHENNIMVRDGEFLLIDLDGMCIGSSVFEFSQSYSVYRQTLPDEIARALGVTPQLTQQFLETFLSSYFREKGKEADLALIRTLDDIFTDLCSYSLFLFPLLNGSISDPEERKSYVRHGIGSVCEIMERTGGRLREDAVIRAFD